MAQFLALSILGACAAVAAAVCLRDAVRDHSGRSQPAEPADREVRDIVY